MKSFDNFIEIPLTGENLDRYYHRTSILQSIQRAMPHFHGKLLDAGCGKMPYKEFILQHSKVKQYVGLDIESAIVYDENVRPDFYWDGKKMPFEEQSFDGVFATEVLEHVPDPSLFLQEVTRVLHNKGFLFFTIPFLWPLHETPHDEYRYTPYAMERLLKEAGFTKVQIDPLGGWHASMAQIMGLWLRRSPMSVHKRKILTQLFFPFYKYLLKKDQKIVGEGQMITGISGIAYK